MGTFTLETNDSVDYIYSFLPQEVVGVEVEAVKPSCFKLEVDNAPCFVVATREDPCFVVTDDFGDCTNPFFCDGYAEGYDDGYAVGYYDFTNGNTYDDTQYDYGYISANNDDYIEGWQDGYDDGWQTAEDDYKDEPEDDPNEPDKEWEYLTGQWFGYEMIVACHIRRDTLYLIGAKRETHDNASTYVLYISKWVFETNTKGGVGRILGKETEENINVLDIIYDQHAMTALEAHDTEGGLEDLAFVYRRNNHDGTQTPRIAYIDWLSLTIGYNYDLSSVPGDRHILNGFVGRNELWKSTQLSTVNCAKPNPPIPGCTTPTVLENDTGKYIVENDNGTTSLVDNIITVAPKEKYEQYNALRHYEAEWIQVCDNGKSYAALGKGVLYQHGASIYEVQSWAECIHLAVDCINTYQFVRPFIDAIQEPLHEEYYAYHFARVQSDKHLVVYNRTLYGSYGGQSTVYSKADMSVMLQEVIGTYPSDRTIFGNTLITLDNFGDYAEQYNYSKLIITEF